jgi:Family of unknown function (DUF6338)
MIGTYQAIAVTAIALLPGGLYIWGFESQAGLWGIQLSDRIFRFVGYSALFQAILSPLTYWLYANYLRTGVASTGKPLPLWLWPAAVAYVLVPYATGRVVGWGVSKRSAWTLILAGRDPAPRAWDHLFSGRPAAWIRLKLKSNGHWLGGAYAADATGRPSYVAGFPHPQDLYLAQEAEVDAGTGDFLLDEQGAVKLKGRGLLLRWEEIEYLAFEDAIPWQAGEDGSQDDGRTEEERSEER